MASKEEKLIKKSKRKEEKRNKKADKTRSRNRLPRMIYLIVLIASIIFVSNRGGGLSYVLFFSVLLYIPVMFIQILYTRFAFRLYQDVSGRLLYKNTAVPYQITIGNAGHLPIGGIKLFMEEKVTVFEEDFTGEIFNFLPGESRVIETKMSCKYAGKYTEGIGRIRITDIFGLMEMTYDIPSPLRVNVLPVITDVAVSDVNRIFEEMSGRRNEFQLDKDDLTLGNDIRKYMEGDSLSTVHWKNYARTGQLFVRLPDKQESELLTVVIIPDMDSTIEKNDYMLEYIVSVADMFTKQGKAVNVMYYCGGVKEFLIESYDSFRVFYMDKLKEFGSVGKTLPSDAVETLKNAAANTQGAVCLFSEEEGTLKLR